MFPIGKAISLPEIKLEAESQVTETDVALAIALWRKYAPARFRSIIDGGSIFEWEETLRVYRYKSNGRIIDPLVLRNSAIEPFLQNVKLSMRDISRRLQDRQINLPEWQFEMMRMVKGSQIAVSLVASGGADNNDEEDTALIALGILAMLSFLKNFALDIESGKQLLNGLLLTRTDLYAFGGRDAYEEARRNGMIKYGVSTQERRVLDPEANHCVTDKDGWIGCVELADRGWQPIGTLPRLYDTPCRTNCQCHFEFR